MTPMSKIIMRKSQICRYHQKYLCIIQLISMCSLLILSVFCFTNMFFLIHHQFGIKSTNVNDNSETKASICVPQKNIVFLKVHKTGSTTIMNILQRYGIINNLNFVLPKNGHYLGKTETLMENKILPPPQNESYNILCNHVIYNQSAFQSLLPRNMYYFTILREPLSQFVSAFLYYRNVWRNEYLLAVPGEHFIGEYLKNPVKYESLLKNQGFSYTNNRMSYDLGLKLSDFHSEAKISKHISDLDKDFHLVLIQEYFDISMILLKRKLCWQMKDMLYIERNVASSRNTPILTAEDTNRFKKWAKADYILYEHYLKVFWYKIRTEEDILSEVYHYQSLLYQTKKFCMTKNSLVLEIQASVWNKEILLLRKDCDIMLKSELDLVYALQRAYRKKLNL
ncbi:galactose-3-O-sulfotransferase 2-like [Octopus sinensis]|uniref:Galactose-3-O-sulfotransferase 2-like n=1 Tax=Octopus sinensis TaxID=2607531 RepID=A0A6P7T8M9_9MOLL|nr:galactose-3-O-sulfotransferase 2-like [Octopus sinensis]